MDNENIIELKKEKKSENKGNNLYSKKFQTNPIMQKMIRCNESAKKMKFKLKDLFQ